MTRLLTVTLLLVCVWSAPALAEPIEVTFDFEEVDLGLVDPIDGLELTDATTGLTVTFDRISNFVGDPTAPGGSFPLEVVDLLDPSIGYGTRTLSPFLDTTANPFVGYLRISIDTSALIGPAAGRQVGRMDWDAGDWVPSDDDDLWIGYSSSAGETGPGYVPYDNAGYPVPSFGSRNYTLISVYDINQVRMFVGTGETLDAPNSAYYDNFVFSLVTPGFYAPDDETPISNFGGGGTIPGLGDQVGQDGGTRTLPPIPEPGTLFGVGAGLIALGIRARRRRR